MNFKTWPLLFFISLNAWSFDKDFNVMGDRLPLEFNLLFNSLKNSVESSKEKLLLVSRCQDLNKNLGFLKKEHILLFVKSEVIKHTLEHKFHKVRQFDVSTRLITRLEEGFAQKKKVLNPFSQWIWNSIIAELNHRKNVGLISTESFMAQSFEGTKRQDALRFEKYLTYLLPWIDQMDSLDGQEFNSLTQKLSWEILQKINERSILFRQFAPTAGSESSTILFNIPERLLNLHPEDIKKMNVDEPEMTLKERSEIEKTKAKESIDQVSPDDMSTISEDVMKEIEDKSN